MSYALGVFLLGHIELSDYIQVLLEERVRLVHTVNNFVDVPGRIVVSPPLLVELIDVARVVHCLLALVPQQTLLQAGKYRGLGVLQKGDDHEGKRVAAEVAICRPDNTD